MALKDDPDFRPVSKVTLADMNRANADAYDAKDCGDSADCVLDASENQAVVAEEKKRAQQLKQQALAARARGENSRADELEEEAAHIVELFGR